MALGELFQNIGNISNKVAQGAQDIGLYNLSIDDPAAYSEIKTRQDELRQRQALRQAEIQKQQNQRQALGALTQGINPNEPHPLDRAAMQNYIAAGGDIGVLGQLQKIYAPEGLDAPSAVREYEYYNSLSPDQQQNYLAVKRALPRADIGGSIVTLDPRTNQILGSIEKTLAPSERPDTRQAQKAAEIRGKGLGEAQEKLSAMQASMPKLMDVTAKLSDLADKATYTTGGRLLDVGRKELGLPPRESAVARKEYMSTVDNEVLPLLKQTFGAAFTVQEGEALRNTLGDPDATPEEKKAVLDSFIQAKAGEIESLQRQTGQTETQSIDPVEAELHRRGIHPLMPAIKKRD